jgi:beta-lactamase superfamily II metal-dependent hydrolase
MKPFDREINYLVVTHPDMDHYGGCADVLERFKVDKIFFTGVEKPDNYWKYFWELAHKEGEYAQVGAESELDIGKTKINFFYPDHDVTSDKKVPGQKKSSGDNDTSIVFKLAFGRAAALFTGDSGISLEKYLIGKYDKELKSSVLKVGHHGSAGSSSQEFLDAVKPEVAVISVGKDNKYGHPSLRALKRLQRSEAKILRTDEKGSIILKMYENGKVEVAD